MLKCYEWTIIENMDPKFIFSKRLFYYFRDFFGKFNCTFQTFLVLKSRILTMA